MKQGREGKRTREVNLQRRWETVWMIPPWRDSCTRGRRVGEERKRERGGTDGSHAKWIVFLPFVVGCYSVAGACRQKRGKGAVGARMDAAGPYAVSDLLIDRVREEWEDATAARAARPRLPALPPDVPRGSGRARRQGADQLDEGLAAGKVCRSVSRSGDKERKRKEEKSGGRKRHKSSRRSTSPTKKKKRKERRKSNVDEGT